MPGDLFVVFALLELARYAAAWAKRKLDFVAVYVGVNYAVHFRLLVFISLDFNSSDRPGSLGYFRLACALWANPIRWAVRRVEPPLRLLSLAAWSLLWWSSSNRRKHRRRLS